MEVAVGGMEVAAGATVGSAVVGDRIDTGMAVAVEGTGVAVGGWGTGDGVRAGGTGVAVGAADPQPAARSDASRTNASAL